MPRKKPDYPDQKQFDNDFAAFATRLGRALISLRENTGISRDTAATAAHISKVTLSRVENGNSRATAAELSLFECSRLCKCYGVNMSDLILRLGNAEDTASSLALERIISRVMQMEPDDQTKLLKALDAIAK